jgi:mannose-6-phosphate isomerase-like protein (cupin superfamily)
MSHETPHYKIQRRERLSETATLRVSILTLAAGEKVPWHHHNEVDDTFVCLDGPMRVEQPEPDGDVLLNPGERHTVPALRPHQVSGADGGNCRFVIVQGIGTYDYIPHT